jgi:hypothetical protein
MKALLAILLMVLSNGSGTAQNQFPDNKSEAATPASPVQRNAPPEKISPSPLGSPSNDKPDAKAEARSPELNLDPGMPQRAPIDQTPRNQQRP